MSEYARGYLGQTAAETGVVSPPGRRCASHEAMEEKSRPPRLAIDAAAGQCILRIARVSAISAFAGGSARLGPFHDFKDDHAGDHCRDKTPGFRITRSQGH